MGADLQSMYINAAIPAFTSFIWTIGAFLLYLSVKEPEPETSQSLHMMLKHPAVHLRRQTVPVRTVCLNVQDPRPLMLVQ